MTREFIFDTLRTIFVEVRGCEEGKCTLDAKIFNDLGCESIDLLEVSFRIEEAFGFPYNVEVFTGNLQSILWALSVEEMRGVFSQLRSELYLDVPDDLPGPDPLDKDKVFSAIQGLFTVGYLVNFVERRLAEQSTSAQAST